MSGHFASIDLGGTNIHGFIADRTGQIAARGKIPTQSHEGPEGVLERIAELVRQMVDEACMAPAALGLGMPGLVDMENGLTKFLPNFPGQWPGVPVCKTLEARVDCPVYLLNDARCATLGEQIFGHGREVTSMAYFGLGTGVGGGVVLDGHLRLGPDGAASEIGHQTLVPDGPLCGCGNHGCLEALVSGPALTAEGIRLMLSGNAPKLQALVEGDLTRVSPATMATAAADGEAAIDGVLQRAAEWLGIAAANVVTTFHPELIVLGGGVSALGERLARPVQEIIHRRVGMFPATDVRVKCSALGDEAGLYGGLALAFKGGYKYL